MFKYILIIILLLASCNYKNDISADAYYQNALNFHNNKDFDNTLISLNFLIDKYPDSKLVPQSYFLISEIYLNEFKEYDISIIYLNKIISLYPDNILSKKSLFTLAYINANYIDSYSDAINLYNDFKNKYPNDDLIPSVDYELENLVKIKKEIEKLINS